MQTEVRPFYQQRVVFGRNIPPDIDVHLQEAAAQAGDFQAAEKALLKAQALAPNQLEVFIALYKLYFYRGYAEKAQDVVLRTLQTAAQEGGFDSDWQQLSAEIGASCAYEGPFRTYLYSLKALCFIRLRQNDQRGAEDLLSTLEQLDPEDHVGAAVLRDLADGLDL